MKELFFPLYVNEGELYEQLGVGKDKGRAIVQALLPHGFPKKDPVFNMYYFPAVKAFLDARNGLHEHAPISTIDGKECWSD